MYEPGSPELDPGILKLGVPVLGICYGFQVMAQQLGGEVAHTGAARVRGDGCRPAATARGALLAGQPAEQTAWMSHGDSVCTAPDGFTVLASSASTPVAAFANDGRSGCTACSGIPRSSTRRTASSVLENFLHDWRGNPGRLDQRQRHRRAGRAHPRPGRLRAGDLRTVRRRRLRRGRRARAQGRRRPAHLRLRRPRPAARRTSAGRSRRTTSPRPASAWSPSTPRTRSSPRSSGVTDPETQAQDHRARVHPQLRGRRGAVGRRGGVRRSSRSGSSCRARCIRMSWSPAAAPAPRTSRATTTSAVCRKTSSSNSSSRCAPCSRTRCARSAASWACPR